MVKRIISGVVLVAIVAAFFFLRNVNAAIFQILLMLLSMIGSYEVARAMGDKILPAQKWLAVSFSAAVPLASYFFGFEGGLAVLVFAAVAQLSTAVFCFNLVTPSSLGLGFLSVFYPAALLLPMSLVNGWGSVAPVIMLLMFLVPSFADTFAFFVGSFLKGPKLCPNISPKKTVSGGVGGLIGGGVAGVAIYYFGIWVYGVVAAPIWLFIAAGVVGAVLTAFGDLVESVVKRKVGIKDMGNLIPGHGGIMDRIDGISFACPFVYLCFRVFFIL